MDAAAIERIGVSFNHLAPRGPELVERFYTMLFARYPALRRLFPADLSSQKRKFLNAIALVIQELRHLDRTTDQLHEMGRRHGAFGAQPAHYTAFRDTLIDVMAGMSGPAWTVQLTSDWKAALDSVSKRMLEGQTAATA